MIKKFRSIFICILILFGLNSCVLAVLAVGGAAAAGGTYYYYENGNYIIEIPQNIRVVYNATIKTFQMSNSRYTLKSDSNAYSDSLASVKAESSDETSINVSLKNIDNRSTEIKIRYGLLGDAKKSEQIANEIARNSEIK